MLIVSQTAFAVACFWDLSDIHKCLGEQPAGYKLPHDWLVRLGMDLAVLCVMWRQKSTN